MTTFFKPFKALRPQSSKYAQKIIAPPYDVMMPHEAKELAALSKESFVHVSRAEVNLSADTNPHSQIVYDHAAQALNKLIEDKALIQEEIESWYLIQIEDKTGHSQIGFGGIASCHAYEENKIARHELTRFDKEEDRLNQIKTLGTQTGPVLLTHRPSAILSEFAENHIKNNKPFCTAQTPHDGATHRLWIINSQAEISIISTAFDKMEKLWIADGHHRSAAATRLAAELKHNQLAQWFLAVSFPSDEMKLLDYNRLIVSLKDLSNDDFLNKLTNDFHIQKLEKPQRPQKEGQMTLLLKNAAYHLTFKHTKSNDAVESLDVAILENYVLKPILDITDIRSDNNIHFAGGARGISYLEEKVNSGQDACAFAMFPTPITAVMEVANNNQIMPPKSTWFEPKLADGLISHVLVDENI